MFMNAHASFTWICLKWQVMFTLPYLAPLVVIRFNFPQWGNILCPTFLKFPSFYDNVWASMVFAWMAKNLMTPGCLHEQTNVSTECCWCTSHLSSQSLECDQTFWFTPYAPHHYHHDSLYIIMGTHLPCLASIRHYNFQFRGKGFKSLLPSPLWSNTPCPFVDKGFHTIVIKE
jgi:hypothetical protein